jgi:hypothetical protein
MKIKFEITVVFVAIILGSTTLASTHTPFLEKSVEKNVESILLPMEFSVPLVKDNGAYITIEASGDMTLLMDEGFPILPYKTEVLTFPVGTHIYDIDVKPSGIKVMHIDKKVAPALKPVSANTNDMQVDIEEGEIYKKSEPYPSGWISHTISTGIYNNERVIFLSIHVYPIRYIPARNEMLFIDGIEIGINYRLPEESFIQDNVYDLVIISPSKFSDALQPLVEHKVSHGIKTILVDLEEIYGGNYFSAEGRDDAEKIKYFIKNSIEQWGSEYVLFVGGRQGGLFKERWLVPVRYTNLDDESDEKGFLSDLYFSDIYKYEDGQPVFDDWDSNRNGIYAEWDGTTRDVLDLCPDVYIGRLACRNKGEVGIIVDKIIEYENNYAKNMEWFSRMVVVGGDSWPNSSDAYYEGEEENEAAIGYMKDFIPLKLWTSLGTLQSPEDVIESINQGCGFLFFDGHGNPMQWGTHPPHNDETFIDGLGVRDVHKLENGGMYPVCLVGGCHNSQFNVSVLNMFKMWEGTHWLHYIYYGETAYECWSWRLAAKPDGGSIATLGYTGYDYFAIGDYDDDEVPDCIQYFSGFLHVHFFEEYGMNGTDTLGMVHVNTLIKYITELNPYSDPYDAKTVEEWVLLGDPSLKIGGYPPK